MTAYCHHCKLPTFEGHASPDQCIAALRAELDRKEVWLDNQRLQVELSANQKAVDFAAGWLRFAQHLEVADRVKAMAKGSDDQRRD